MVSPAAAVATEVIDLSAGRKIRQVVERHKEKPNTDMVAVIAIDPGGTTGWSLMVLPPEALSDPDERILANIVQHKHGEVSSLQGKSGDYEEGESIAVDDLWTLIEAWPEAAVVIEDFILNVRRRDRDLLSPVRITSKITFLLWKNRRTWTKQSPSDAKNTCSDERLKKWGMYQRHGGLEHARDADRHALLLLRKAKASARDRARIWPHLYSKGAPYGPE